MVDTACHGLGSNLEIVQTDAGFIFFRGRPASIGSDGYYVSKGTERPKDSMKKASAAS